MVYLPSVGSCLASNAIEARVIYSTRFLKKANEALACVLGFVFFKKGVWKGVWGIGFPPTIKKRALCLAAAGFARA
jgi:hypothetical protein